MRRVVFYIFIALIFLSLLVIVEPWDRALSDWFRQRSQPNFADFMDRSLFEGDRLGAGDIAVFLQLGVLGLWLGSLTPAASKRLIRWQSLLATILISSILTAFWVHLLKGVIARPRPYELGFPSNSWQGLVARLFHGWGSGSFPSGHTANAMSLIVIAYALCAMHYRRLAWIFGALVLLFVVSMALSRVMVGAHWPSDTVAAAALGWIIAHKCYRIWQYKSEMKV